jgi:8-oxo-dGTP pyrophosphatase MutT (NUDIX family)
MTGSSILPATLFKGKLYFLFGKENEKEDSAKGFSDFGGGVERGETIYETAMREGGEELTGFLGDGAHLRKYIKTHGGVFPIVHGDYHVHIFFIEYDPKLPVYYNLNHRFLWDRMDQHLLNSSKLFEKIEIQWFSIADLKQRRSEFRSFYQEIVDQFILKRGLIKTFLHPFSFKSPAKRAEMNEEGDADCAFSMRNGVKKTKTMKKTTQKKTKKIRAKKKRHTTNYYSSII